MELISTIANLLSVSWQGQDAETQGFSTDSRTIQQQELFIALKGQNFDGHECIEQAVARGASAAIVDRPIKTSIPTLVVPDTHQALLDLAQKVRKKYTLPVIAITGSCGKTSTRALLQNICAQGGKTLASVKSYNNNIGVPLTLLRLNHDYKYAVIEIGANHLGEIDQLVKIVQPDIAVITNAGPSHLSGFGDLDGVAHAKSEIFNSLGKKGTAIINHDDAFAAFWTKKTATNQHFSFGVQNKADIMAKDICFDQKGAVHFHLHAGKNKIAISLKLFGLHNVYNALAAAACALSVGLSLDKIKKGLESTHAETHRLVEQKGLANATIIDDSYNANPASVKAAIDVLSRRSGTRILVLGDMLELGKDADLLHRQIGFAASQAKISYVFCYGQHSRQTAEAFGQQGQHFENKQTLITQLRDLLDEQVTVLVKGSNSMKMYEVTQSLLGG